MQLPLKLRQILGRTRLAVNYALGRQAMAKDVTSYDDDAWIVSYPRSGNTWTRFLIANLISAGETVDWTNIERRVPDIYFNSDAQLRALPRPRYFKSHEPYRPNYRRVVYIVRDPRDIAISYYHFARKAKWIGDPMSMDVFLMIFLNGSMDKFGSWGENVGSWLGARRDTSNFIIVRYEDLLQNTESELARVAQMLGLPADEAQIRHAIEQSCAPRLRMLEQSQRRKHRLLRNSRPEIPFVRLGKSGQWHTDLPPETARQIESTWGCVMRQLGYLLTLLASTIDTSLVEPSASSMFCCL